MLRFSVSECKFDVRNLLCGFLADTCTHPERHLRGNIQIFGASGWENLGNLTGSTFDNKSKLNKPFISCNLLANTLSPTPAGAVYSFGGELTGNMDVNLNVFTEWTPFANSYSAHMDVEAMLAGLSSAENVDATVYIGTPTGNGKYSWDPVDAEWLEGQKLAPMEAFILHNRVGVAEESTINYNAMVWTPATAPSPAPRRVLGVNHSAKLRIVVENEYEHWWYKGSEVVDKTELDNRIKELSAITTWCGSKKYRNIKVAS